jgi:hypothetical protein
MPTEIAVTIHVMVVFILQINVVYFLLEISFCP